MKRYTQNFIVIFYGGDLRFRLRFIVYKIKRWDLQISKLTRTGFIELSADALRFTTESGLANTESDFRDKETRVWSIKY